jgi:hypothetical protein
VSVWISWFSIYHGRFSPNVSSYLPSFVNWPFSHRTRPRNSGMSSGTGVRPSSSCQAVRQRHELDAIAHEPRFPQLQRSVT